MPPFSGFLSSVASSFKSHTSRVSGSSADEQQASITQVEAPPHHPRYEACTVLSANGIPNVVWLEDALAAYGGRTCSSDLFILVDSPRKAADVLSPSGGYTESSNHETGEDGDDLPFRHGIHLRSPLPEIDEAQNHKIPLVLVDAAVWNYQFEEPVAKPKPKPKLGAPVPTLNNLLSSFLEYWLRIPEDEYKKNILASYSVANLIYEGYTLEGPNYNLIRSPEFASGLKPEVRELHFDIIGDYPGQSNIGSYRKHEYHALRYRQIQDGEFTARPYPNGNFPVSLAEYPHLTGMDEELKQSANATRKNNSTTDRTKTSRSKQGSKKRRHSRGPSWTQPSASSIPEE